VRALVGHLGFVAVLTVTWLGVLAVGPALVLGWKPVVITSGSMQPAIRPGDIVVAVDAPGPRVARGEVVVFRNPAGEGLLAHRIRSRSADGTYVTKGDANRDADSTPLRSNQVVGVGRMVVPLAGLPLVWARTGQWLNLALSVLGVAVALWWSGRAFERFDSPTSTRPGRTRGRARRRRMRVVLPFVVGVLVAASAVVPHAAGARFVAATDAGANSWAASTVFGMRLATGTYVGDTSDDRVVGVGFAPDAVFVKCTCGLAGIVRTSTMVGDASKVLGTGAVLVPNGIQSFDTDGFVVGTDTKVNGGSSRTYHWVALQRGTDFAVGSYLGDGTDDRSITGVGLQPAWVLTLGDGDDSIVRPSSLTGDASYAITGTSSFANRIQALESDGFQVGSNATTNESGTTYHFLAWKAGPNVTQGTYVGSGTDSRSITGVGFHPELVWIKRDTSSQATWRPESATGDVSLFFGGTVSNVDRIQALESDGFQIGTNAQVNSSGATYHYLALRDAS
jgi:signal peptidase I